MKRNQSGFTLIEIAIVLVIIGLLLGGVLKGQELINSAKVKNLAGDFKNIPIFIYGYQDKYKALPGDDASAVSHLGAGATTCTTVAAAGAPPTTICNQQNGVIDGAWDATAATSESYLFWQHIRMAGFASGSTTTGATDYLPTNATGGKIGVQSNNGFATISKNAAAAASAMTGTYIICSAGILGKFAKQLDITLDNGDADTGAMRVADPATAGQSIATTAITDGQSYTVCMGV
jgi:prepilin-type N-terminal cleavage/methylation domain-containing protein